MRRLSLAVKRWRLGVLRADLRFGIREFRKWRRGQRATIARLERELDREARAASHRHHRQRRIAR